MNEVIAVELQKLNLTPGDYLFVKVNSDMFNIGEASNICSFIKEQLPEGVVLIGYPNPGVEIQVVRTL